MALIVEDEINNLLVVRTPPKKIVVVEDLDRTSLTASLLQRGKALKTSYILDRQLVQRGEALNVFPLCSKLVVKGVRGLLLQTFWRCPYHQQFVDSI